MDAVPPTSPPRIVVVGSCNLDQLVRVERAPGPGETVGAHSVTEEPGGKGLNQALAAARAGAEVAFVGAVGNDTAGDTVGQVLRESGVDTARLRRVDEPTGRALIVVDESGENRIVVHPGANGTVVALDDDDRAVIAAADALLLQLELPESVAGDAARVARGAGVPVGLTPAPVRPLDPDLLGSTSVLFVNQHEATMISGQTEPADAVTALLDLVPMVVLTRGAQGSDYADRDGRRHHQDAEQVAAVDTTAAGDVFAGVFTAVRCAGLGVPEAMRRATRAAALTVQRRGSSAAIPTAAEYAG